LGTAAAPELATPTRKRGIPDLGLLAVAGMGSLGAGAIHAAAIGVHSEHRQAVVAFTIVAAFQLGWGALVLTRPTRLVGWMGALGNLGIIGGWVLAKTQGISFIDGLEVVEPVQAADALAAGLAGVAVVGVVLDALYRRAGLRDPGRGMHGAFAMAVLLVAVPGMVAAGNHHHSHGNAPQSVTVTADGTVELAAAAVVPPHPYDPTKPIDLGGIDGVTPEEQARAENLIAITLIRLPKFADPATAQAAGFVSIGDGITGFEHYINWNYIDDGKILDPDYPESLVYNTAGGQKKLEAAMYMLPPGTTLNDVPDVGGALTQWHIHDNLCFTNGLAPHVAGLTNADGTCSPPLVKLEPVPMIHVWTVPQPCGPFAALEGVGGGQIKDGETRNCDHVHGSTGGL